MNIEADYIVYIGRFQPAHKAHIETIERAAFIAKKRVIILIGSANQPRTIKNTWKWDERADMIYASLSPAAKEKVTILPLRDITYNDPAWEQSVQEIVASVATEETDVVNIIGYSKDETSYYLGAFPQWDTIEMENIEDLHATDIRRAMFENKNFAAEMGKYLPKGIHDYIQSFMLTPDYEKLVVEFEFEEHNIRQWDMNKMLQYFVEQELENGDSLDFSEDEHNTVLKVVAKLMKRKYTVAPYENIRNTVDMVVVKSGHVLLVRRKAAPGKGLYAMPGGYLNGKEWSKDGALRELQEETRIKEPPALLKSNIKANDVFEHPDRSIRGRVITRAYIIKLPDGPLSKVKAADDAEAVKWVPLNVFAKMEDQMFEDHFQIINTMIAKLTKENN